MCKLCTTWALLGSWGCVTKYSPQIKKSSSKCWTVLGFYVYVVVCLFVFLSPPSPLFFPTYRYHLASVLTPLRFLAELWQLVCQHWVWTKDSLSYQHNVEQHQGRCKSPPAARAQQLVISEAWQGPCLTCSCLPVFLSLAVVVAVRLGPLVCIRSPLPTQNPWQEWDCSWQHPHLWIELQVQIPLQWFGSKISWACVTVLIRTRHCYKEFSSWSWSLLLLKDLVTFKTVLFHLIMKQGHMVYEARTQGSKTARKQKQAKKRKGERDMERKWEAERQREREQSNTNEICCFLFFVMCHFARSTL